MRILRYLTPLPCLVWALVVQCTSVPAPTAGGGSDLPNAKAACVAGLVVRSDSSVAQGAGVYLRSLIVSGRGDSIVSEKSVTADSRGAFRFDSLSPGRYVLLCENADTSLGAIDQFIVVKDSADSVFRRLTLQPTVDLVGRLEVPPSAFAGSIEVSLPGAGRHSGLDPENRYVLNRVPQGTYNLVYTYDSVINFMLIGVTARTTNMPVFVRTFEFTLFSPTGDSTGLFQQTTFSRCFSVTPIAYAAGQEPPWYQEADLERIEYYRYVSGDTIRCSQSGPQPKTRFDTLLAGVVFRMDNGMVALETEDLHRFVLVGDLVSAVGPEPRYVVAAVRGPKIDKGVQVYEVIETYPPLTPRAGGGSWRGAHP